MPQSFSIVAALILHLIVRRIHLVVSRRIPRGMNLQTLPQSPAGPAPTPGGDAIRDGAEGIEIIWSSADRTLRVKRTVCTTHSRSNGRFNLTAISFKSLVLGFDSDADLLGPGSLGGPCSHGVRVVL